jgi:hypothetical protein
MLAEEHTAEIDYRPGKARQTYRMVILRKRIRVRQGQLLLDDEIRYFFYVTTSPRDDSAPPPWSERTTPGVMRRT